MTALKCMEEFSIKEESLRNLAELAGVEWAEDFDDEQTALLTLAIRLQEYQLHEEQIRICCREPLRLPEIVLQEIDAHTSDPERSQKLQVLLEMIGDEWDGSLESLEFLLCDIEMYSDGIGLIWGPIDWTPLIIPAIVFVLAMVFRPVLKDMIETLLANFG